MTMKNIKETNAEELFELMSSISGHFDKDIHMYALGGRDFDDIKQIFKNQKIDVPQLIQRYKETMEDSVVADSKQKLLDLIEIKFKEWKSRINKKIINEVKLWEPL